MLVAAPPPLLGGEPMLKFLAAITVLLLVARFLGLLAALARMPAIVGELATGVLLGPSLLGKLTPELSGWLLPTQPEQMHLLDGLGQVGIILLVGLTGSHLDLEMIRRRTGTVARVSLGGLLIPLGLGIALGFVAPSVLFGGAGGRGVFALFLGVAMCVSAIPVIAKTLTDMRLMHRDVGQLALASATVDDAVGWTLLSIVSAVAIHGAGGSAAVRAVLYLAGFLFVALVVARPLIRWSMRSAGRAETAGPSVITAVLVILIGATTTQALGMEPIFGAFIAGALIGLSGSADLAKLAGLRTVVISVLGPIFLAVAGLRMDLTALASPSVALAAVAVLTLAVTGKFAGVYLGSRLSRLSHWEAIALSTSLNSRGVVELVVALTGLRLGVLNTASYTIVALVAIATSVLVPPLLRVAVTHLELGEGERLRQLEHDAWDGLAASTPHTTIVGSTT
jgi:Kef-type K+ transport system membrane component KefB